MSKDTEIIEATLETLSDGYDLSISYDNWGTYTIVLSSQIKGRFTTKIHGRQFIYLGTILKELHQLAKTSWSSN